MGDEDIFHGWIWEMFQEYVRKITRTASTGAMPLEEMQQRFRTMHRDFEIKVLVTERVGMIVMFRDLDSYTYAFFEDKREEPALLTFLGEKYGFGKYKINQYYEGTFIATKNFTTAEGLPETWRTLLAEREAQR